MNYDPSLAKYLPDPKMTPGDTLAVTPQDFCVSGYSSKVRDVPESVKNEAYNEYRITSHKPGEYEVDHLISLELGARTQSAICGRRATPASGTRT